MADILPTDLFPNYVSDGTDITIPLATLAALTSGEANTTTGNGSEVLRALLVQAKAAFDALPSADRPTRMNIAVGNPTGINANTIRQTYTISFDLSVSPTAVSMAAE